MSSSRPRRSNEGSNRSHASPLRTVTSARTSNQNRKSLAEPTSSDDDQLMEDGILSDQEGGFPAQQQRLDSSPFPRQQSGFGSASEEEEDELLTEEDDQDQLQNDSEDDDEEEEEEEEDDEDEQVRRIGRASRASSVGSASYARKSLPTTNATGNGGPTRGIKLTLKRKDPNAANNAGGKKQSPYSSKKKKNYYYHEDDRDEPDDALTPSKDSQDEGEFDDSDLDDETFEQKLNKQPFSSNMPKTMRQLAKEDSSLNEGLLELPVDDSKKVKRTEAEMALRRSETARRRRNQSEKKLEDDKIETINKLLKKQVSKTKKIENEEDEAIDGDSDLSEGEKLKRKKARNEPAPKEKKERPLPLFRYVVNAQGSGLSLPLVNDNHYEKRFEDLVGKIHSVAEGGGEKKEEEGVKKEVQVVGEKIEAKA